MSFSIIKVVGKHFTARFPGGSATPELVFPNDFPGHPSISEDRVLLVEAVKLAITTDANIQNRRPRMRLVDDQAFFPIEWRATATVGASQTAALYLLSLGMSPSTQGNLNRETLPSGLVLLQANVLQFDLISVQAGDVYDEVIVSGHFIDL